MSLWTTLNFCKLYRFGKSLPSNMAALWAWKPADLLLYAVPVFENHRQVWSHPKQAEAGVSGYGLNWKRAFCACFRENERFHAQNWVYKFGHRAVPSLHFHAPYTRCQHETVRKETTLKYLNIPDFFTPCFCFWTFFSTLISTVLRQNDPDVTVRKWNASKFQQTEF